MGSATKLALRTLKSEIDRTQGATTGTAAQLFEAAAVVAEQSQLRALLADPAGDERAKRTLVERLFGGRVDEHAVRLLEAAAAQRWSSEPEFVLGLQEIAVRAAAQFSGEHERIGQELQGFLDVVAQHPDLELTLGSKLGDAEGKRRLIDRLFGGRLSEPTLVTLRHLVAQPNGRRIRRLVTWAQGLVADQANRQVATVTVAKQIDDEQVRRLQAGLAQRFGRPVSIAQVVDPSVIGGVRVQLGDDVIDDTVQSKLGHLRRQFA